MMSKIENAVVDTWLCHSTILVMVLKLFSVFILWEYLKISCKCSVTVCISWKPMLTMCSASVFHYNTWYFVLNWLEINILTLNSSFEIIMLLVISGGMVLQMMFSWHYIYIYILKKIYGIMLSMLCTLYH